MAEINHLLALDGSELEIFLSDEAAQLAQLDMWLDTPKGQYWGNPSWGHRLNQFKFSPTGDNDTSLTVAIENIIILDLRQDLPNVAIVGLEIKKLQLDMIQLNLQTNFGLLKKILSL